MFCCLQLTSSNIYAAEEGNEHNKNAHIVIFWSCIFISHAMQYSVFSFFFLLLLKEFSLLENCIFAFALMLKTSMLRVKTVP